MGFHQVLDPGRLQVGVEIEIRARHFSRVGRDPTMPLALQHVS